MTATLLKHVAVKTTTKSIVLRVHHRPGLMLMVKNNKVHDVQSELRREKAMVTRKFITKRFHERQCSLYRKNCDPVKISTDDV